MKSKLIAALFFLSLPICAFSQIKLGPRSEAIVFSDVYYQYTLRVYRVENPQYLSISENVSIWDVIGLFEEEVAPIKIIKGIEVRGAYYTIADKALDSVWGMFNYQPFIAIITKYDKRHGSVQKEALVYVPNRLYAFEYE